jgi:hypothetical protein
MKIQIFVHAGGTAGMEVPGCTTGYHVDLVSTIHAGMAQSMPDWAKY